MRDKSLQTGGKRECSHDHDDGQARSDKRRARRTDASATLGLKRETHPDDPCDGHPGRLGAARDVRTTDRALSLPPHPVRRCLSRERHRRRPEDADQHCEPDAEDRPVHHNPGIGIQGPHGTQRREGRKGGRNAHGDEGSEHDCTEDADQSVARCDRGAGPESPHHPTFFTRRRELAGNRLDRQDQADKTGNDSEATERERLRLEG